MSEASSPVRRTHWLDVVAPLLLTLLALTGLEGSFSDRSYLVVGGVGAVMAGGVAVLAWTQGRTRVEVLLVLLVLFAPLGATVSRHEGDLVTVPAVESMSAVLTGAFTGPAELLSTIPPADAAGAPLALSFILGYVMAGSSVTLALFGRRPVLPALPLLLGLALTVLLGVQHPDGVVPRGAVCTTLVVVWSSARGLRGEGGAPRPAGLLARGVASVVLVGLVSGLVAGMVGEPLPSDADQRWVLRGQVGGGEDVSRLDNPLSDFRTFTRQLPGTPGNVYNEPLFEVTGLPPDTPMRFVTLDVYDGMRWRADNRSVPDMTDALFLRIGSEVAAPLPGREVEVDVDLSRGYTSSWLPLAGQLTGISFTFVDGRAQREDVRYNPATLSAVVRGGLVRRDDYRFTAVLPRTTLRVGMSPYVRGRNQPQGRFLDESLEPWRRAALSPMARVFSLAEYLRTNGRYSDGAESWEQRFLAGHDRRRLGAGFFEADQMVGNHEQFTAFLALAANRLGVPARVVVGAVPSEDGAVRGSDVTTWVEVRIADGSWRILPAGVYLSTRAPRRAEPPKQDPGAFVAAAEEQQEKRERAEPPPPEPERNTLPPVAEPVDRVWPRVVLGVAAVLLVVGGVPAAKWWRRRRRRAAASSREQLSGAWQELLDVARDLGYDVPSAAPRPTQAQALGGPVEAAHLADGVFASSSPRPEEVDALWSMVVARRAELIAQRGWVGALRAWWNPASLSLGRLRGSVRRALSTPARPEHELRVDDDALAR